MEVDLKRRKVTTAKNSGCRSADSTDDVHGGTIAVSASNYPGINGFVVHDLILNDILSRLPIKTLMRFKSVCKQWRSIIEQDQYFIDLYNTRSEARQKNNDTATIVLISPVKPCGTLATNVVSEDNGTEIKMILFEQDRLGGSSCAVVNSFNTNIHLPISSKKVPLELRSFHHTSILEPVYGLVCFVNLDNYGSVLIHNPSTREKTSWIKTKTSMLLEHFFLDQKLRGVQEDRPHSTRAVYSCMFGFGFDPTTRKHKVLCIYQLEKMEVADCSFQNGSERPTYDIYLETYCEVMTVGNNSWREIDDDKIPLNMELGPHWKSVYVNGSIYWMCYQYTSEPYFANRNFHIMAFDVRSETFRVILIPTRILDDLWRLNWLERTGKWTSELVEVDGHIAILDIDGDQCREGVQCRERHQCTEGDQWINLWIHDENKKTNSTSNRNGTCSDSNWSKETLPMAYRWEELNYLAFKAIGGTDLIITKYFPKSCHIPATKLEYLNYYNRKLKKSYKKQVDMILDPTCNYNITTMNLLPLLRPK